jgi:hypothetical protein
MLTLLSKEPRRHTIACCIAERALLGTARVGSGFRRSRRGVGVGSSGGGRVAERGRLRAVAAADGQRGLP